MKTFSDDWRNWRGRGHRGRRGFKRRHRGTEKVFPRAGILMDIKTANQPQSQESYCRLYRRNRKTSLKRQNGPAIYIAMFTFAGGIVGLPFSVYKIGVAALAFIFFGAILGGLIYRMRSRWWPIDPTAKARRYGYAIAVALILPTAVGVFSGTAGQGMAMILLGLCVGASLAAGILISGDRRFSASTQ